MMNDDVELGCTNKVEILDGDTQNYFHIRVE